MVKYDPAMGRGPRIDVRALLNPLRPLATEHRARRAAEAGQAAAFMLSGVNLVTGSLILFHRAPASTLISDDKLIIASAHLSAFAAGALLGYVSRRSAPVWAAALLFIWAVVELLHWPLARLYGHATAPILAAFIFMCALQGLRGAIALRRISSETQKGAARGRPD